MRPAPVAAGPARRPSQMHAHVAQLPGFAAQQQVSDTGRMHFEAEVIAFGMAGCQRDERLAVAEADFERARGASRPKAAAKSSGSSPFSMPSAGHSSRQARSCAPVMRPARTTKLRIARWCDVSGAVAAAPVPRLGVSGFDDGKGLEFRWPGDCNHKARPTGVEKNDGPIGRNAADPTRRRRQGPVQAHVVGVPGRRHRQCDLRRAGLFAADDGLAGGRGLLRSRDPGRWRLQHRRFHPATATRTAGGSCC